MCCIRKTWTWASRKSSSVQNNRPHLPFDSWYPIVCLFHGAVAFTGSFLSVRKAFNVFPVGYSRSRIPFYDARSVWVGNNRDSWPKSLFASKIKKEKRRERERERARNSKRKRSERRRKVRRKRRKKIRENILKRWQEGKKHQKAFGRSSRHETCRDTPPIHLSTYSR